MDDILSHGGDREPSPWPRRLAAIAALILVAVAGAVYLTNLSRHGHAPVATRSTPVTASPGTVPVGVAGAGLPSEPSGIAGRTLPWTSGLRLPVTGTQPAWFSPASGRSEPIGGLPAVSSGYQFIRVIGGWAVQADPAADDADELVTGTDRRQAADRLRAARGRGEPGGLRLPVTGTQPAWFSPASGRSSTARCARRSRLARSAGPPRPR